MANINLLTDLMSFLSENLQNIDLIVRMAFTILENQEGNEGSRRTVYYESKCSFLVLGRLV